MVTVGYLIDQLKPGSKRHEAYGYSCKFMMDNDRVPSVRELAQGIGVKTTTAFYHINNLKEMGLFDDSPGKSCFRIVGWVGRLDDSTEVVFEDE